jgi:hypothetical protein
MALPVAGSVFPGFFGCLTGDALKQAVDKESWDDSVKALTAFPSCSTTWRRSWPGYKTLSCYKEVHFSVHVRTALKRRVFFAPQRGGIVIRQTAAGTADGVKVFDYLFALWWKWRI